MLRKRMAQFEEGFLVALDHAGSTEKLLMAAAERFEGRTATKGLRSTAPFRAADRRCRARHRTRLHGGADHVLAVDQRTVAIEHNELQDTLPGFVVRGLQTDEHDAKQPCHFGMVGERGFGALHNPMLGVQVPEGRQGPATAK